METISTLSDSEHQRLLDAFLVDNEELEALNARLAAFNMFHVLRIEKAEIRHSNVLAWLLTPGETHGLGATFLRRFLSRLLMESENAKVRLTPAQVELMDFGDVEVRREWENIDVFASSRSGRWCMLIENKIGASVRTSQLLGYLERVQTKMPAFQIIPVLLTLEGDDPPEEAQEAGYISLGHVQVLELTEKIVGQNRARIPADANTFLGHYIDTLRRLTMQDQELIDLCRTIYRKHRDAIDLVVEHGASSQVLDACEERLRALVDCEFILPKGRTLWFLPREMGAAEPAVELLSDWRHLSRHVPIMCWLRFRKRTGRLQATMEVGPVTNYPLRHRLLMAIKEAGFRFNEESAFTETSKFTRFLTISQKFRATEDGVPDDSPEHIAKVTESLWKKLWEDGHKIVDVLKDFDWRTK